jgi:hypothetical protein
MSDNQQEDRINNDLLDILNRIYQAAYGSDLRATSTRSAVNQRLPDSQNANIENIIASFNQAINNTFMSFAQINPEVYNVINEATGDSQEIHLIPQYKSYPESDYSMAYMYFSSTCSANPTEQVLSYILDLYYSSGDFPTNAQLIQYAIENSCICTENIHQLANVYNYYIFTMGFIPACNQLVDILEHHVFHREYPTEEQINEIHRLRTLEQTDRERLHAENKVIVACKNLDMLKAEECCTDDQNCGICLSELKIGDSVYKLPQCGHLFHSNEKECLEKGNVVTWLQSSDKCPLCKTEVVLQSSNN